MYLAAESCEQIGLARNVLRCAIEQRPPKLDLENYPHLPTAEVALTRAADYPLLQRPEAFGYTINAGEESKTEILN